MAPCRCSELYACSAMSRPHVAQHWQQWVGELSCSATTSCTQDRPHTHGSPDGSHCLLCGNSTILKVHACPVGRTDVLQLLEQASTSRQQRAGAPHLWLSPLLSRMSRLFSSVSCATRCRLQHARQGEKRCRTNLGCRGLHAAGAPTAVIPHGAFLLTSIPKQLSTDTKRRPGRRRHKLVACSALSLFTD